MFFVMIYVYTLLPLVYAIFQRRCCRNFIYGCQMCSSVAFRGVCGLWGVTSIHLREVGDKLTCRSHSAVKDWSRRGRGEAAVKRVPPTSEWCEGARDVRLPGSSRNAAAYTREDAPDKAVPPVGVCGRYTRTRAEWLVWAAQLEFGSGLNTKGCS